MFQPGVSHLTRLRTVWLSCDSQGTQWPGPAQRCIQPPLHPSAGSCYTHSWHSTRCQGCFLIQHSSYPGTAAHTFGATALHCKPKQQKDSTCWLLLFPWLFGPEQEARALSGSVPAAMHQRQLQPRVEQMGRTCVHSDLTESSSNSSENYSVLKVQRGISELPVIPNIHSKVNNISCWVFSCN